MTDVQKKFDILSDSFLDKMARTLRRSRGARLNEAELSESEKTEQRQIAREYLARAFPKFSSKVRKDLSQTGKNR